MSQPRVFAKLALHVGWYYYCFGKNLSDLQITAWSFGKSCDGMEYSRLSGRDHARVGTFCV